MTSDWQMMKVENFIEFNPRLSIKQGTMATKISMDKLQPFTKFIMQAEKAIFSSGSRFCNGDIILARITPCLENGKTAFVDILAENEIAFGSTEFIVLRAKEGISDSQYVYYLAISPKFRDIAIKSMVGSSGRQRVQIDVLKNLELKLPSLIIQKKIGKILANIDKKIALNQKINDNLHVQAKTLFNKRFLKIDSVPHGWKKGNLLDIANYLNGLPMQKYRPQEGEVAIPVLKIKELRQGMYDSSSEQCSPNIKSEYIIKDGDIIFSWSGSLLIDIWCGGTCGLNQHLFKVTSDIYDKWFYYLWTSHYLDKFIAIAADKATTMGHIKRGDLAKAEILVPSKEDYEEIRDLMNPIFELIIETKIESRKLTELRNALLPRLMSGEIDVSEISI